MELYQEDNSSAFDSLYLRYNGRIYSYLNKRLSSKDNINDVFQKIFLKLHKTRSKYDSKYLFAQWIYTIARSVMLDSLKKKELKTVEFSEYQHFSTSDESSPIDLESEKLLTAKEKQALIMRYHEDSDFLEISKVLETSESNSRKIISRGLKKLKKKYAGGLNE